MSGAVVPFGKYKDKPVELMISDRQYCEWLAAQPWFKEKYQTIYNVIINAGPELEDTPEHNRLQAMFLNKEFCKALIKTCCKNAKSMDYCVKFEFTHPSPGAPIRNIDVLMTSENDPIFYKQDVWLSEKDDWKLLIEIKPTIGDDFPSVVRQAKSRLCNVIFYEEFSSWVVTIEQVQEMFPEIKFVRAGDIIYK
jgi:hypothetical protein